MIQQTEFFGRGSIKKLKQILDETGATKVFLVTGKDSYVSSGAQQSIDCVKRQTGFEFTRFSDFSPNPQKNQILSGFELFNQRDYDLILGVGGGSSIDVAKTIKMWTHSKTRKNVPLVAIPTTAGSGSEATSFIVYYEGKNKISSGNPDLTLPDYAILEPSFLISLPRYIAASTGMDALGQAIESYWSIHSTDESKRLSSQAISLIVDNFIDSLNKPNESNQENLMRASNLAGKSINITKTTASHSLAYPITSYFGLPHGHAVALTLGEMLVYNSQVEESDCSDKRGFEYVRAGINSLCSLLKSDSPESSRKTFLGLMSSAGLKSRFSDLGLKQADLEIIIEHGFNPERVKNNPRVLTSESLRAILNRIY